MFYSGAGGKLIEEKTRSKKSRDTVPLSQKNASVSAWLYKVGPALWGELSLLVLKEDLLDFVNSLFKI
jgi:hypothetical protein